MEESANEPEWMSLSVFSHDRFDMEMPDEDDKANLSVLRAWDRQFRRRVACKYAIDPLHKFNELTSSQLEAALGLDDATRSAILTVARTTRRYNLLREARLLAMIDHPNVMPALEAGRFDDLVMVLLMPYLDGGTAAERKFTGQPWTAVLDAVIEIGRGVEALHDAGILHRDLKPSNILFDNAGRPRVSDLGLSCRMDDTSAMAERVGTTAYMPPGVYEGGFKDVRDDLYAFCMIAFEMFYGRPPFDSVADRDRGRVAKVERAEGMSRRLHKIIVKGLAPARADRWANMSLLLQQLEKVRKAKQRRGTTALLGLCVAASVAMGMVTSSQIAQAGVCDDVLSEVWTPAIANELRLVLESRRAAQRMQDYALRWATVRQQECDAAESDDLDTEPRPCNEVVRDRFQATVHAFRTAHLRKGLTYSEVIA